MTELDARDITKLLIDEYNEAAKRLAQFMVLDERLMATGVSVIAAAASIAIGSGKTFFLLVVPVALAALFLFVDFLHAEVLALGGYKAVLEEAIELRIGTPISGWERYVASSRHTARSTNLFRGIAELDRESIWRWMYVQELLNLLLLRDFTSELERSRRHANLREAALTAAVASRPSGTTGAAAASSVTAAGRASRDQGDGPANRALAAGLQSIGQGERRHRLRLRSGFEHSPVRALSLRKLVRRETWSNLQTRWGQSRMTIQLPAPLSRF